MARSWRLRAVTTYANPTSSHFVISTMFQLSLLSFPSLTPISEAIHSEKEIYDVTFSATTVIFPRTHACLLTFPKSSIGRRCDDCQSFGICTPNPKSNTFTQREIEKQSEEGQVNSSKIRSQTGIVANGAPPHVFGHSRQ